MYIFLSLVVFTLLCQQRADRQRQKSGTFEGGRKNQKIQKVHFLFTCCLHFTLPTTSWSPTSKVGNFWRKNTKKKLKMYIFLSHVFSTLLCQQQADLQRQNSGTFEGKKPKKKIKKYIFWSLVFFSLLYFTNNKLVANVTCPVPFEGEKPKKKLEMHIFQSLVVSTLPLYFNNELIANVKCRTLRHSFENHCDVVLIWRLPQWSRHFCQRDQHIPQKETCKNTRETQKDTSETQKETIKRGVYAF